MDGGGQGGDLFLHPLQLFRVMLVEDGGEVGHAIPESSVPSLFVLWGQLDPGLHVDGEALGCGVVGEVFAKDCDLAGVL